MAFEQNVQATANDLALVAACYVALNESEKANDVVAELMKALPEMTASVAVCELRFRDVEQNTVLLSRMQQAGIPD